MSRRNILEVIEDIKQALSNDKEMSVKKISDGVYDIFFSEVSVMFVVKLFLWNNLILFIAPS